MSPDSVDYTVHRLIVFGPNAPIVGEAGQTLMEGYKDQIIAVDQEPRQTTIFGGKNEKFRQAFVFTQKGAEAFDAVSKTTEKMAEYLRASKRVTSVVVHSVDKMRSDKNAPKGQRQNLVLRHFIIS